MTTEETELTFIRCPNCRSLVPAVATRCRMCGYNFESAGEAVPQAGADAGKAKSRVRQRTISASAGEVDDFSPHTEVEQPPSPPPFAGYGQSVDSQSSDPVFPPEEEPAARPNRLAENLFIADDTLEQFSVVDQGLDRSASESETPVPNYREASLSGGDELFESDVELQIRGDVISRGSNPSGQRRNEPQAWDDDEPLPDPMRRVLPASDEEDAIDADLSFDGDTSNEPDRIDRAAASDRAANDRADSAFDSGDDEEEEEDADLADSADDLGSSASTHEVVGEGATRKRRRRRRRRRGGASQAANQESTELETTSSESTGAQTTGAETTGFESFGVDSSAAGEAPVESLGVPPVVEPIKANENSAVAETAADSLLDTPETEDSSSATAPPVLAREPERAETLQSRSELKPSDIPATQGGAPMSTADVASPRANGSVQSATGPAVLSDRDIGMLVGWMVTYGSDPKGSSLEIRGGRFFVGGQRLRETDIVIADRGLSAPHCLVAAIPGGGLRVQDLMSEGGTFIKRNGANTFERVNDVVVVEHGDCLRFGEYEVRVCLMP